MIEAYSTSKNILFTSSLGTFGRLIGFATNLLVAYLFGANNKTDILFYCIIFFSSLNGLFNSFNSNILLSQFILIKQERSESDAWQFVNTVFSVISCAMVIMIFLLFLYYEHIILIFSRFSAQDINSVKLGILLIIPTMYLLYISDLIINVIQAHKNFFITSVVPLIGGIVQIVGLFFFAQMFEETSIAIAYFLSSAAQALVLYHFLKSHNMELMFSFKLFYKLKRILKLSFTIVLSQLSAFIVLIYPNYMASGMEIGTLTAVGYARRLFDIMPGLLIYPVSLVLTPRFTEMARQDYSYMGKEARRAIDLLSFVLLPISIFIALFAPDITRLLFERGSYSEHHIIITAESMRYFLVSLVVIGSNSIITRALMATQDLKIAYLSLLFAIIPAIGIPAFTYSACFLWGYLGISIGYSFYMILVHQSLGYVMFYCMIEKYRLSEVITSYVLILVFSFLAIYFAYYSTKIFNVHIVFKLIFAFAISSLIYLLLHYIFKTDLLHLMVQEVRIVSGRYAKNSR